MLNKAEILARMGLDNTGFKSGMRKTENFARRSVRQMLRTFAPLIGLAGIGGATRASVQLADEIKNLATVANTTTTEFQRLAAGAEQYGVNQDKLADIFKDTSDKVGDFLQNGAGPLKNFFENIAPLVGITADEFRNLSGPDALQLYFNAVQQANIPMAEQIFYLEAVASDASKLIPLLRDSGAEFKRLGDAAAAAGAIMDEKTIESLNRNNDRITRMKRKLTVLWGEILVNVVPAFKMLTQGIGFVGDVVGTVITRFISLGKAIGTVVTAAIQPAITAFGALAKAVKSTDQVIRGNLANAKKSIGEAKDEFITIKDDILEIPKAMQQAFDDVDRVAKESKSTFKAASDERKAIFKSAIDELTGKADEEAERLRKERESLERELANAGTGAGTSNTKRDRDEAAKLAKEMDKKRLQELNLALIEAEITGKEKLIEAAKKELEYEKKVQQIISETNVSRERAIELANQLSPGKNKTRGSGPDGTRFETQVGPGGEREKIYYRDGKKLGTAEQAGLMGTEPGADVSRVPDAMEKTAAARSSQNENTWKSDIAEIRSKLDQLDGALSGN